MKNKTLLTLKMLSWGFVLALAGCVNDVSEEAEGTPPEADTTVEPISFGFQTRAGEDSPDAGGFKNGDTFGVFGLLPSQSLNTLKYIDNLKLTMNGNSELVTSKKVYYPKNNTPLKFISYYPYQPDGFLEGTTSFHVKTLTDQQPDDNYNQSLLLVAQTDNILPSNESVPLEYVHQFTRLSLKLTPGAGMDVNSLLAANPTLTAIGFSTEADYDLSTQKISNIGNVAYNIRPHGTWTRNGNGTALVGQHIIIIPQPIDRTLQFFQMELNGQTYKCSLQDGLTVSGGTDYEINIETSIKEQTELKGFVVNIKPWEVGIADDTDNQGAVTAVYPSTLTFNSSNTYRIYRDGIAIGEINKEYLGKPLYKQAVTYYPVDADNDHADLTQGIVLELLGETAHIHGGTLEWNIGDNSYTYTQGTQAPITCIGYNDAQELVYSQAEATLEIAIEAYTLDDNRGTDIVRYPIVKVGSQYWMRNDLSTAYDNLYNPIAVSNELNGTPALFKVADKEVYFYSGELINLHTLPYTGWAVPTDNDWIDLSSYVEGNASKVKTGTWSSAIEDATIRPATNETMLGINPVGTWWTSGFYGEGAMVGYWSLIEDTSEGDLLKAFTFKGETNSFDTASPFVNKETKDEYKAFSVRLIKK